MIYDPLPPTTNWGVWEVLVEFLDEEDNTPIDFEPYDNIRLEVIDPWSQAVVMVLSRDSGIIATPSPGFIEWRVGKGTMTGFHAGTYKVRLSVWDTDEDDAIPLMDTTVPIIGEP